MAPRPYSERSALPNDPSVADLVSSVPTQDFADNSTPSTLSGTTTPSPTPLEVVVTERLIDTADIQENVPAVNEMSSVPCYPTSDDIVPYDHSLPDFVRQITNQSNLAEIQSLSLRVISTLISLHRMSAYLPNLRELNLEGSVLHSLRDIGCSFKNLQILKIGRCQLDSLDGTFGLSSLRELHAQKNLINDISPCSNLPHIRHIDVSWNRIRNISYAGFLSVCSKLKSIVFTGNPAVEVPGYRKHVRRILPQIESLDGVSFTNDDAAEEMKSGEVSDNNCEGSDSSSAEVPDFLSISSSDSLNNLLESEEDSILLLNKNKEKHVKDQLRCDTSEYEIQESSSDLKNKNNLQAKIIERTSVTTNQKSTSLQKLDKDIENRSKKSNLLSSMNFNNNLNLGSEISNEFHDQSPSTSKWNLKESSSMYNNENSLVRESKENNHKNEKWVKMEEIDETNCINSNGSNEEKFGTVKKKSLTAFEGHKTDDEIARRCDSAERKLTTGMPVCGNLAAALRNRRKSCNNENEANRKACNFDSKTLQEEEWKKDPVHYFMNLEDNINGLHIVENEDDLIEENVLASSQRWREAFRRYRSNNRASWEGEDQTDQENFSENLDFNF